MFLLAVPPSANESRRCAAAGGIRHEAVTIELLAAHGDEEVARLYLARVALDPTELGRRVELTDDLDIGGLLNGAERNRQHRSSLTSPRCPGPHRQAVPRREVQRNGFADCA